MSVTTESGRRADELVRRAHGAAYHYPPSFEGFSATVEWRTGEDAGTSRVTARTGPEIELEAGERADDGSAWVARELRSIVGHRQASDYDRGDGAHGKELVEAGNDLLGEQVALRDSYDSSYRIREGQISTVTRTAGPHRFTIVVHDRTEAPDGRSVPTSFTVFYWGAESDALVAAEAYRDTAIEVDGIVLPASRTIVRGDGDGVSVKELVLRDHALLGAEAAS